MISDKVKLVDFLLRRSNAKGVLLYVCRSILEEKSSNWLSTISRVFDLMNSVYKSSAFGPDGLPLPEAAPALPFMSLAAKSLSTTTSMSAAAAATAAATAAASNSSSSSTSTFTSTHSTSTPPSSSSLSSGSHAPVVLYVDQTAGSHTGLLATLDADSAFSDAALAGGAIVDAKTSVQRSLVGKCIVIDQADMFSSVFHPLEEHKVGL